MPPKAQKAATAGRLIGYARVSTEEQGTEPAAPPYAKNTPPAPTAHDRCWRAS